MGLACTHGVALTGLAGQPIEVQVDMGAGLPGLSFTGLPDTSVNESRDRIRSALQNSAIDWPNRRTVVALLPADVRKVGSRFDLAVAMALLAAADEIPIGGLDGVVWVAELGLDGRLRPVRGVLPSLVAARAAGFRRAVVAPGNAAEAALIDGLDVRAGEHLADLVAWLRGDAPPPPRARPVPEPADAPGLPDLSDVAGQRAAKRAVEIAAAGGHHLYLVGAPGAGKTMLAQRLPGLLPPLDEEAALEVTAVHSVAGVLGPHARLLRRPPWQAPHHSASTSALVGGGSGLARPGAISMAHHGVLFLDEAPEFKAETLDALRQPLETGQVVLHRSGGAVAYPARFQLVLAANPCPCGLRSSECICPATTKRRYLQRLSGPLLDRVDLRVDVEPIGHADLFEPPEPPETSAVVAARVASARSAALDRWRGEPWRTNADVPGSVLRARPWALPTSVIGDAQRDLHAGLLTARGFDRVLRIAWTLADLHGHASPDAGDVGQALFYRTGRGESWAA
ncbi:MAG: YifB family Mg chelatase-like AAA ATPase [Jatrophihabitans sp.]|uniref:YifB family Mg chelatase-like AAA ATPase n=1 Tax=Jatrophihabitans sp. TaxID=1932789 RepID=UPI003F7E768D